MTAGHPGHRKVGARWPRLFIVLAISASIMVLNVLAASDLDTSSPFVTEYRDAEENTTKLLLEGDGQFFGMLAQDPTLSRPDALDVGDPEGQFAYRAMRPAFGWAAWALSFGQPGLVPLALITLTVLSVGLLYLGVDVIAANLGRDRRVAMAVLVLPGVILVLERTGPEIAASAFACLGVASAIARREGRATAWLSVAVLLRETLVLVVVGLVLARCLRWTWATIPPLLLVLWVGVVYLRVGALPAGESRFELAGLLEASKNWDFAAWAVVLALLILLAVAARRSQLARALSLPHVGLMLVMGPPTGVITSLVRILLPIYALMLPFVAPPVSDGPPERAPQGSPRRPSSSLEYRRRSNLSDGGVS